CPAAGGEQRVHPGRRGWPRRPHGPLAGELSELVCVPGRDLWLLRSVRGPARLCLLLPPGLPAGLRRRLLRPVAVRHVLERHGVDTGEPADEHSRAAADALRRFLQSLRNTCMTSIFP